MTTPLVSVVIATRNRARFLDEALRSYERITTALPWDLIVVDNGSTDDTAKVLAAFGARTALPFRALSEPLPAASRARNAGWHAASGAIVALTDDDCYPRPDYIDRIAECFADPAVAYLGGRIELHDPLDAPVTLQLRDTPQAVPAGGFIKAGLLHGANMAVRRSVLEATGGFDIALGAGTRFFCEDLDLLSRASAAGFAGGYDPRFVVAHHHRRRDPVEVEALRHGYDIGRGAYYAKCLCDPRRRGGLLGWWSRKLPHTVLALLRSARVRTQLAGELHGAVAYLHTRAEQRDGGLWR